MTNVEVAPRYGLQNASVSLSTDEKLELVSRAVGSGVRNVEVTSFALPNKVPPTTSPTRSSTVATPTG